MLSPEVADAMDNLIPAERASEYFATQWRSRKRAAEHPKRNLNEELHVYGFFPEESYVFGGFVHQFDTLSAYYVEQFDMQRRVGKTSAVERVHLAAQELLEEIRAREQRLDLFGTKPANRAPKPKLHEKKKEAKTLYPKRK